MAQVLPPPGSPNYLQALVSKLADEVGSLFPPQIFTSILLCLVAGHEKHLILHVREEDVADVKALVVRILVCIFGLPTQRIQCRTNDTVDDFLESIFLVPASAQASSSKAGHARRHRTTRSKSQGGYRGSSIARSVSGSSLGVGVGGAHLQSGGTTPLYHSLLVHDRNSSLLTASVTSGTVAGHSRKPSEGSTITMGLPLRNQQSIPAYFLDDASVKALRPQSTHGFHIETNPPTPNTPFSPLSPLGSPGEYPPAQIPTFATTSNITPRLPHALVLSRTEKSSTLVQHALVDVLRTKRIILNDHADETENRSERGKEKQTDSGSVWNLPEGFIVVCVVPTGDGCERPPLHKSLLDRFAFCAPIKLEANLYNASPGPFRRTSLVSQEDVENLRAICDKTHISPILDTYLSSLLSASRHHHALDGTLISARCVADYTDLVRASQVIFGRREPNMHFAQNTATPSRAVSPQADRPDDIPILSATEVDARRMLPFVLEHRLRVRDHPGDELLGSLFITAVGGRMPPKGRASGDVFTDDGALEGDRPTIHTILEEILDDV